jgi:NAD(P)-dependent dehydrogenase (short-subunit alcohol dehydrogenase family)
MSERVLEAIYTTNFLSSFLLTHLLEPHLSLTARILFTSSSSAHFGAFFSDFQLTTTPFHSEVGFHYGAVKVLGQIITQDNEYQRYANSKLMQNVFANLLQRYFDQESARNGDNGQRRLAFAVSPGLTRTEAFSKIQKPKTVFHDPMLVFLDLVNGLGTDVAQGAATAVYLASSMDERVLKANAGGMWEYMGHRVTHSDAYGKDLLERFWTRWQNDAHVEWT